MASPHIQAAAPPVHVVVNPTSAAGRAFRRWRDVEAHAREVWGELVVHYTEARGHGAVLAADAVREGASMVVAVGGDGTIHETVNGLMRARAEGLTPPPMAVLPAGTGGDFAKALRFGASTAELVDYIAKTPPRALDVGRFAARSDPGFAAFGRPLPPAERSRGWPEGVEAPDMEAWFINVLSFGMSGEVVARTNRSSKAMGGTVSFLKATLATFLTWKDRRVQVSIDDGPAEERVLRLGYLANGIAFGAGMRVAPEASPFDGVGQTGVIGGINLLSFFALAPALYGGTIHQRRFPPASTAAAVHRLRAWASPDEGRSIPVEADGENRGLLPLEANLIPGALQIRA